MAVGSFDQDTIDELVAVAVDAGLAHPGRRPPLLAHLPARFVSKIELEDDPEAQLRADVQHLNAHPRLPDHHQPPLASWLQNAYLLTTPSPQARRFRELRARLVGSGRQQEILRSITRIKRMTAPEIRALDPERGRGSDPRAGLLLGGRFTLEKQLGRGAVATVWRASDLAAGVPVAVKILHRRWADNPERRERFFAGARQMAQFAHPHIVPVVLPEGRDAGCCYCVLEYLDAGDLEAALREGRIRRSAALRALLRVASGVAAMHAAGVMHLDLKPQNILLGSDGRVMLGDFDRVRNAATEGGSTTDTVESIFYLAPETFDETRRPGPAADVFSLGMTALFVLHGDKLPAWIVRRPAALLRRIDCPEALRQVIGRAIELDPSARQTDVESLALAMQEALGRSTTGGLPRVAPLVSVPPPSIPPPRAAPPPGSGPMPRVSPPPRVGRTTDNLPPVTAISGEHPAIKESGAFRALSRSGGVPAISAAEAFDAEAASLSGAHEAPGGGSLPPPSVPPASLPPPRVELPPARTGELMLEDSIDSALEMLDQAAAAALAEEFGRPERRSDSGDSALLPAPGVGGAPIDPISDSIDLDGSGPPMHSSGHHVSIPGDENRRPWNWVERSGGFMVADPSESSAERALSLDAGPPRAASRPPWHWAADRPTPPPAERTHTVEATDPSVAPLAPVEPSEPPSAEGALPLDLSDELLAPSTPPAEEETAEEAFLPPPPDLAGLVAGAIGQRETEPRAAARSDAPTRPVEPEPAAARPADADPVDDRPTDPGATGPLPAEPLDEPGPDPALDRRRWLGIAALGLLGAGVAWWLTRGDGRDPLPEVPRPTSPPPDPNRRAVDAAARSPDAAPPDAAPPDAAPPDAAPPDAAEPDAAPPDAAPPRRRRRRRRRRARPKPKPKPTPKPAPEPLIEIPDEIQQMLGE